MTMLEFSKLSVELNSPMTDEYKNLLLRQMANQAYCELEGARFYSKWFNRAPGIEERKIIAALVQEEFEHWALTVELMLELGFQFEEIENRYTNRLFLILIRLASVRATWSDTVMFSFLMESAAFYPVRDNIYSSYAPWARMSKSILEEEEQHRESGANLVRNQIRRLGRDEMQKSLKKWWPLSLNVFGSPNSKNEEIHKRFGFHIRSNEERRQNFRDDLEPIIRELDLEVPKLRRKTYPFF